jgi:NADH-quinone oxidoreductase subunit C
MLEQTLNNLKQQFRDSILDVNWFRGELSIVIKKEKLLDITRFLREDEELSYKFLSDICGVDHLGRSPRFDVIYNLCSLKNKARIRLKVMVDEKEAIPSLTKNWKSANWLEREIYDMFGLKFENHPDLRRILLPDSWQGHPLRKDFPLTKEEVIFRHNQNRPPKIVG